MRLPVRLAGRFGLLAFSAAVPRHVQAQQPELQGGGLAPASAADHPRGSVAVRRHHRRRPPALRLRERSRLLRLHRHRRRGLHRPGRRRREHRRADRLHRATSSTSMPATTGGSVPATSSGSSRPGTSRASHDRQEHGPLLPVPGPGGARLHRGPDGDGPGHRCLHRHPDGLLPEALRAGSHPPRPRAIRPASPAIPRAARPAAGSSTRATASSRSARTTTCSSTSASPRASSRAISSRSSATRPGADYGIRPQGSYWVYTPPPPGVEIPRTYLGDIAILYVGDRWAMGRIIDSRRLIEVGDQVELK